MLNRGGAIPHLKINIMKYIDTAIKLLKKVVSEKDTQNFEGLIEKKKDFVFYIAYDMLNIIEVGSEVDETTKKRILSSMNNYSAFVFAKGSILKLNNKTFDEIIKPKVKVKKVKKDKWHKKPYHSKIFEQCKGQSTKKKVPKFGYMRQIDATYAMEKMSNNLIVR